MNGSVSVPNRGAFGVQESTIDFYDRNAVSYAHATLSLPMDELPAYAQTLPSGARVVDLGCGAGRDLRAFVDLGLEAVGLDASRQLAKLAAAHSGAPVVVGDMRALPFRDGAFDAAWSSASLLHLTRSDIPHALAEVWRVLGPSGRFFSSVKRGSGEGADAKGRWFTYFQPEEWREMVRSSGFPHRSGK